MLLYIPTLKWWFTSWLIQIYDELNGLQYVSRKLCKCKLRVYYIIDEIEIDHKILERTVLVLTRKKFRKTYRGRKCKKDFRAQGYQRTDTFGIKQGNSVASIYDFTSIDSCLIWNIQFTEYIRLIITSLRNESYSRLGVQVGTSVEIYLPR